MGEKEIVINKIFIDGKSIDYDGTEEIALPDIKEDKTAVGLFKDCEIEMTFRAKMPLKFRLQLWLLGVKMQLLRRIFIIAVYAKYMWRQLKSEV